MESNEYERGYNKELYDVRRLMRTINLSKRVTFSYENVVKLMEIATEHKERMLKEGDYSSVFYDRRHGFYTKETD